MDSKLRYRNLNNEMQIMKILIIGHARHGKDTVGELFESIAGLKAISSSYILAREFLYDLMNTKYGQNYKTFEECYEDRHNFRKEWYDEITEYNKDDKARTAKLILNEAEIYVGMRNNDEVIECVNQNLFDLIIWVDASERHWPENKSSFNITKNVADIIIENNGTLEDLEHKIERLIKVLDI